MEMIANIAPDLIPLAFPVADLMFLPGNPHKGDHVSMAESLKMFTQTKPVVAKRLANGKGLVLAGNTTLKAARDVLGWTHVAVSWMEDWTDDKASAYALRDNIQGKLGEDDDELTARMLATIEDETLQESTGLDWEEIYELTELYESLDEDEPDPQTPGEAPEASDEPGPNPEAEIETPSYLAETGAPVIQTTIIFDDEDQKANWYAFIKHLKVQYPDGTLASRIDRYFKDHPFDA